MMIDVIIQKVLDNPTTFWEFVEEYSIIEIAIDNLKLDNNLEEQIRRKIKEEEYTRDKYNIIIDEIDNKTNEKISNQIQKEANEMIDYILDDEEKIYFLEYMMKRGVLEINYK